MKKHLQAVGPGPDHILASCSVDLGYAYQLIVVGLSHLYHLLIKLLNVLRCVQKQLWVYWEVISRLRYVLRSAGDLYTDPFAVNENSKYVFCVWTSATRFREAQAEAIADYLNWVWDKMQWAFIRAGEA